MKSTMLLSVLMLVFGLFACGNGSTMKKQTETSANTGPSHDQDDEDDTEGAKDDSETDEETEVEISLSDLPQSIVDAIAAKYSGAKLREADKITQKNGTYFYDVEIVFQGKVLEVMYDTNGQMLGEETEDD